MCQIGGYLPKSADFILMTGANQKKVNKWFDWLKNETAGKKDKPLQNRKSWQTWASTLFIEINNDESHHHNLVTDHFESLAKKIILESQQNEFEWKLRWFSPQISLWRDCLKCTMTAERQILSFWWIVKFDYHFFPCITFPQKITFSLF